MTDRTEPRDIPRFTLLVYWGCILLGMAIPPTASIAVDTLKHGQSISQAVHQWHIHLFAPGYNLFLIAMLNAIPFILLAVFALLHLGWAGPDRTGLRRRMSGVVVAAIAAVGLSLWTHVMTLWHPDAQGALAYVFLPFVLAMVIPLSYLAGWGGAYLLQGAKSGRLISS